MALYLNPPPELTLKTKEAEAPPDAVAVVGMVPLLQKFQRMPNYTPYGSATRRSTRLFLTNISASSQDAVRQRDLFKAAFAGYLGTRFTVYFDPMGAPGQINARNYGPDYYVVLSPEISRIEDAAIRHTYLHYLIDPLVLKYPSSGRTPGAFIGGARMRPWMTVSRATFRCW